MYDLSGYAVGVLLFVENLWKRAVWLRPMILRGCRKGPPMAGHAQRSEGRESA